MPSSSYWKAGLVALVVALVWVLFMDMSIVGSSAPNQTVLPRNITSANAIQISSTTVALASGELPGYTGWARPERTLAGFFTVQSLSTHQPTVGSDFSIRLWCHRNEDCTKGNSMFYLRAYGPSVIPGILKTEGRGKYVATFNFQDPGVYTLEVVLTYSTPPTIESFPLPAEYPEPAYEGYLIPGFPMQVSVQEASSAEERKRVNLDEETSICKAEHLLETSPTSAVAKARWKVIGKSSAPNHYAKSKGITKAGYLRNVNSLGVHMDYKYLSGCSLLPQANFERRPGNKNPFSQCGDKNLHIVFVGDSVMRVQKAMFDSFVENMPNIQTSYVTLYGGYRRVEALEPTFQVKLEDIQRRAVNDIKVVLFNSGLHDIHRLCGSEWKDDRYEYLNKDLLDAGAFSCIEEYKSLIHDLASKMVNFEADLRVFQSTSAAWPKYGNFGIEWPFGGQMMPMATDIVPAFNEVAFDVLLKSFPDTIGMIDGYWITYSRPDNREIGPIGNKLSHPGEEVQSAMSRIWAVLILDKFCNF